MGAKFRRLILAAFLAFAVPFGAVAVAPEVLTPAAEAHAPYPACLYTPGARHYYNTYGSEWDIMLYGFWIDLYTYAEAYEHRARIGWGDVRVHQFSRICIR